MAGLQIQLDRPVRPRAVVIEHAPASISIGGCVSATIGGKKFSSTIITASVSGDLPVGVVGAAAFDCILKKLEIAPTVAGIDLGKAAIGNVGGVGALVVLIGLPPIPSSTILISSSTSKGAVMPASERIAEITVR